MTADERARLRRLVDLRRRQVIARERTEFKNGPLYFASDRNRKQPEQSWDPATLRDP